MESIIEKAIGWFKDISEATKELTSGNVSHKSCTIRGMANRSAEYLGKHKRNLSVIEWQTGKPKEGGYYLTTLKNGKIRSLVWSPTLGYFTNYCLMEKICDVVAWCKLSDIEPYKTE